MRTWAPLRRPLFGLLAASMSFVLSAGLMASGAGAVSGPDVATSETPGPVAGPPSQEVAARASSAADRSSAANRAIDGDLATRWEADGPRGRLEIDLGELTSVTGVQQVFAKQDVWRFTVTGSIDRRRWVTLIDRSAGASGHTFGDDVNGVWRYVRLEVTGSRSGASASSRELSVRTDGDGEDLATGRAAVASSNSELHEASKAVDQSTSTFWQSRSESQPQWLRVDLGAPSLVTRVVQNFQAVDTYRFRIDASPDGRRWTTLLDATSGARGAQFSRSVDGAYRYVRLTVLGSASGRPASSSGLAVHGYRDLARGESASRTRTPGALTIDLGGLSALHQVRQRFAGRQTWRFALFGSVDGRRWKRLADTRAGARGQEFAVEAEGAFRYVRVEVRSRRGSPPPSTHQLLVYGTPITRNLALNTATTTSSLARGRRPSLSNDGSAGTAWSAASTKRGQWLQLDLGNPSMLSGVRQTFADRGAWRFRIQGSQDGKRWRTLVDQRRRSDARRYDAEVRGTYRFVRLTVLDGPTAASSSELEVYGIGSAVTDRWWERTSGVRKFYVNYYGDTLRGIQSQLDTLKERGYGAIELTTLPEGWPQPFAGLGALDQYKVDPKAGTMADFTRLIEAAHQRGMRVQFFGNLGYPSDRAPFFKQAAADFRKGVDSDLRSWFIFDPASDRAACDEVGGNYRWSDPARVCYYQYWGEGAPAFNYASASWRAEARKYLAYWMDTGIDAMVLDAPYVYITQQAGEEPQLIDDRTNNTSITDVLQRYDAMARPEGGACCGKEIVDPIVNRGYNTVQWAADPSVLRTHDPDSLDQLAITQRDAVANVGGVLSQPPSWDSNEGITPAERLLEIANITTTGSVFYIAENFSDLDYLPPTDIIPTWRAADQEKLWSLMRAQNGYQALAPSGARIKLPTNDDRKYYAYVRRSKQGGLTALTVLNYQPTPQKIAVQLTGSGIGPAQRPVDLVTGKAAPPIRSGTYTLTLPAYGSAVLGVEAGESGPATADGPEVTPVAPNPVQATGTDPEAVQTSITNTGSDRATDVTAVLDAPAGWTVTPTRAPTSLAGGATGSYAWRLNAGPSTPPGRYRATVTVSYESGGVTWIAPQQDLTLYLDASPIFTIGTFDDSAGELALAPASYGQYPTRFPDGATYTVGTSTPSTDWPYVQPGPLDPWAGSREHAQTIRYTLSSVPDRDLQLTLAYADTHSPEPPSVRVTSNETALPAVQLPAGGSAGVFGAAGQKPTTATIVVPRSSLRIGENVITIVNVTGSWSVYDAVQLLELDRARPGERA